MGVADGRYCGFESHDSTKEPEKGEIVFNLKITRK